jgi:hypothetical protein
MSERRFRKIVPGLNHLEYRCLMSTGLSRGGDVLLARQMGGVATERGARVTVTVDKPSGNAVQIWDDLGGLFKIDWNGSAVHSFTGVQDVSVLATRARNNQVTINLADATAAAPATASNLAERKCAVPSTAGGPLLIPTMGEGATQVGTQLTVTVNKPGKNTVQIFDSGAGSLAVQRNGGAVHDFTGITTIVVHAENAKNDQISFDTPPL